MNSASANKRNSLPNSLYYIIKPVLPRRLQLCVRRKVVQFQSKKCTDKWPIDENSAKVPDGWHGWPSGKKFALVLTHDVESSAGQERCPDLMELEEGLGFRSSFNFVPLRYAVSPALRESLAERGFEVGVHGLYHDGKYYLTRNTFAERAKKINGYLKEWNSVGYRAPAMFNKLEWFHDLDIEYDASTFDTDPFEPNAEGVGTVFPYFVRCGRTKKVFVELPYTLVQDFTLFVLMRKDNIDIWKRKLDWLASHGGVALINTHPDYMKFGRGTCGSEQYPAERYSEFLEYVNDRYRDEYWDVLPRDMARFWSAKYLGNGAV
jgi:peptidoglycan/xylan/chitin deacetylase (PgdA/CDA1 family)